jgi:hypothetical protein
VFALQIVFPFGIDAIGARREIPKSETPAIIGNTCAVIAYLTSHLRDNDACVGNPFGRTNLHRAALKRKLPGDRRLE